MLRCTTDLKGIVIDCDKFTEQDLFFLDELMLCYRCLLVISDSDRESEYISRYGEENIYTIKKFQKLFAPSPATHGEFLERLKLQSTEIAYLSKSKSFCTNAMSFLSGVIWISGGKIDYENAGSAPDIIAPDMERTVKILVGGAYGYIGEQALFPGCAAQGILQPVLLDTDGEDVPMYMLGRYFGAQHYMSQLHPYSSAIYLNKKEGKAYGKFNKAFAQLYMCGVAKMQVYFDIDGVLAVPPRPGHDNRFEDILKVVANKCNIENYDGILECMEDYPTQKSLSSMERQENIEGVFECGTGLKGKNVVLLDDIATTGATLRECVNVLRRAGVSNVYIVVLAINQLPKSYWSSDAAQVKCPGCNEKMRLLVNSRERTFFYSCQSCNRTRNFVAGRQLLIENVDAEKVKLKRKNQE